MNSPNPLARLNFPVPPVITYVPIRTRYPKHQGGTRPTGGNLSYLASNQLLPFHSEWLLTFHLECLYPYQEEQQ